jgi:hypothetical protein
MDKIVADDAADCGDSVDCVPCDAVKWSGRAKLLSGRYFMVVAVMSTVCYCTATAIQIPNELWVIAGMIATHYFDKEVMKG